MSNIDTEFYNKFKRKFFAELKDNNYLDFPYWSDVGYIVLKEMMGKNYDEFEADSYMEELYGDDNAMRKLRKISRDIGCPFDEDEVLEGHRTRVPRRKSTRKSCKDMVGATINRNLRKMF